MFFSFFVQAVLCKAWVVPQREDVFLLLLHRHSQKWANIVWFLAQEQTQQLHPRHHHCVAYSKEMEKDGAGPSGRCGARKVSTFISGLMSQTNPPGYDSGHEYILVSCLTLTSDVYMILNGFWLYSMTLQLWWKNSTGKISRLCCRMTEGFWKVERKGCIHWLSLWHWGKNKVKKAG